MKKLVILLLGVFLLSTPHSTATPLDNLGVQVEMSYKYGNNISSGVGPRRTKGQQIVCPISVYINNIDKCIEFVGIDNTMAISYIVTDELGEVVVCGSNLNDWLTIDTSYFASGAYALNLLINDNCFTGIFDIESE